MVFLRALLLVGLSVASRGSATTRTAPGLQPGRAGVGGTASGAAAMLTGPPQSVYDWARDHCPGLRGSFETQGRCANDVQLGCDPDVPDAPLKVCSSQRASASALLKDGAPPKCK